MSVPKCTPLKIVAYLSDGRINSSDGLMMFDSILYHAWFAKYAPHVLRGEYKNDAKYIGLPLKQLPSNRWAASRGIYTEANRSIEYFNKRPNFFDHDKIHHLKQDKGMISDSVGAYRAYRVPNIIRTVKDSKVTFYAIGHKDKIADLLSYMRGVGKKPAMGWGIIDKWEITDIDNDYTTYHPEHGLMRPIEVTDAETVDFDIKQYPIMQYGVKPPYHNPKNNRLCYVPIVR